MSKLHYEYLDIYDGPIRVSYLDRDVSLLLRITKKRLLDSLEELVFTLSSDENVFFLCRAAFTERNFEAIENRIGGFEEFGYEIVKMVDGGKFRATIEEFGDQWKVEFLYGSNGSAVLSLVFTNEDDAAKMKNVREKFKNLESNIEIINEEEMSFFEKLEETDFALYELNFKNKKTI